MPSPVGHALGGLIIGLAMGPSIGPPRWPDIRPGHRLVGQALASPRVRTAVWLAGVACLPDLDFLWGRHGAETHSLGAALLALAAAWLWTRGSRPGFAVAVGLAWLSHPVFDWLGSDDTPPLGVMALWPFTRDYYFAHAYVFDAISRRYWLAGFAAHNLRAVAREVLLLAPIALAVAARKVKREK